ncbi:hypothetical protein V8E53_007649 [Lactarius tabidus]
MTSLMVTSSTAHNISGFEAATVERKSRCHFVKLDCEDREPGGGRVCERDAWLWDQASQKSASLTRHTSPTNGCSILCKSSTTPSPTHIDVSYLPPDLPPIPDIIQDFELATVPPRVVRGTSYSAHNGKSWSSITPHLMNDSKLREATTLAEALVLQSRRTHCSIGSKRAAPQFLGPTASSVSLSAEHGILRTFMRFAVTKSMVASKGQTSIDGVFRHLQSALLIPQDAKAQKIAFKKGHRRSSQCEIS